jgi:hypothetical protein
LRAASSTAALARPRHSIAFLGFLEAPALQREAIAVKRHEIELGNGITIAIHSKSFRSVRGLAGFSSCLNLRNTSF